MNIYSMTLDGILATLLLVAIIYCMRLDGKLKALRTGNTRMVEAARELQQSALHAQGAVTALRQSADAAGRELQAKIDEARALAAQPLVRDARDMPRDNVDFTLRRRSVL
ncbi:MAG TPA: DUF6468 domain-containing protein [Hyphomonadaceae bacterium]|nr:DUF6468 domain-containing protein [Hyphomonadaceae bacterium]